MENGYNPDVGAFTIEKAAKWANVSIPKMQQWVNLPDFPAFRSGRRWIIPVSSFCRWLEKHAEERAEL